MRARARGEGEGEGTGEGGQSHLDEVEGLAQLEDRLRRDSIAQPRKRAEQGREALELLRAPAGGGCLRRVYQGRELEHAWRLTAENPQL